MSTPETRISLRTALGRLPGQELVRTYVWEKPVRIAHWLMFFTFVALSFTGLYIHRPFLIPGTGNGVLLMARMRFIHEISGFILAAAIALRFYWFFKGNYWARWTSYVPIRREQWNGIGSMLEFYLFMRFMPRAVIGHNPLAAFAYVFIYGLIVVEILSGLVLFDRVLGNDALHQLVGWVPLVVNLTYVRLAHYFLTFVFFAFVLFHVYASVLVSLEEENGLLDSIFSGWKFIPAAELRHEVAKMPESRRWVRRHQLLPQERARRRAAAAAAPPVTATPAAGAVPAHAAAAVPVRRPGPGPVILYRNVISYIGTAIAFAGVLVFAILTAYHVVGGGALVEPWGDLLFYIGPPVLVFSGIALIAVGMYFQWLRWRTYQPLSFARYPKWDLNISRERKALLTVALASGVLVLPATYGTGQAYVYTDAVEFCGPVCHSMRPEYVTYQHSPHANVECAACHIGPGVMGYVRAKSRGMLELYATITNDFPRPLPVTDMARRPARDNCQSCHWPGNRVTARRISHTYFLADEQNTRWEIDMVVPIDGSGGRTGSAAAENAQPAGGAGAVAGARRTGAHWHIDATVEFAAKDEMSIPWVRAVNPDTGVSTIYTVEGQTADTAPGPVRSMDCVDCHNRPSHQLTPPSESVDLALAGGDIDASLPFIKQQAVTALTAKYATREEALAGIDKAIRGYYEKSQPQLVSSHQTAITTASTTLQATYDRTFFPEMNAQWTSYPTHDGHLNAPGCDRCHDGQHKSPSGRVIPSDCTTCHQIQRQGTPGNFKFATSPAGLEFEHPVDIGDVWKTAPCSACHTGGGM